MQQQLFLCINCERYLPAKRVQSHLQNCLYPTRQTLLQDEWVNKIQAIKLVLEQRTDRYSQRALEILTQIEEDNESEKQLKSDCEEVQILSDLAPNDLILEKVVQLVSLREREISKLSNSHTNKTKELSRSYSKEELRRQISQKKQELETYRKQAQSYRLKTMESQIQLSQLAQNY